MSYCNLSSLEIKNYILHFAAKDKLKALQIKELVKMEAVTNFLDNGRSCVVAILKKMFEKSPVACFSS